MAYLPSIPLGNQTLKSSQPQIKENFTVLNNVYSHDHFAYTETNAAYIGRHKFVTIPANLTLPTPGSNELAIYSKIVSGNPEIFWRRNGSLTELQLTSGGYPTTNPGSMQLKAAVRFQATTGSISYSFNVTSVSYSAPQNYQVNFTTALGSANYYPSVLLETTVVAGKTYFGNSTGRTSSHYSLIVPGAGAADFVQVLIFGV